MKAYVPERLATLKVELDAADLLLGRPSPTLNVRNADVEVEVEVEVGTCYDCVQAMIPRN